MESDTFGLVQKKKDTLKSVHKKGGVRVQGEWELQKIVHRFEEFLHQSKYLLVLFLCPF